MLRPIKCKNTVETAIENIGTYIAYNLHPGDVLPSERDLATQLRISRNITREALQHFRTLGIIESKPKVGAVVARLYPGNVYEGYMPFIPATDHSFRDLAHLRLMLELGCAEEAIKRVTPEDIEQLTALSEKIQELSDRSRRGEEDLRKEMFDADVEFHTKMMQISGNMLIETLIPLVVEFFGRQFLRAVTSRQVRLIGYQEHFKMIAALKNGALEELSSLIRSHIRGYIESYETESKKSEPETK